MTDLRNPTAVRALLDGTTKGPWVAYGPDVKTLAANIWWTIADAHRPQDARLIAAAPDLAAALADALDEMARLRAMLDKAEQDREAAGVLGATCAEVALMLANAGLTPCVGADSDGEYVLGPFRDAQGQYHNGSGSVFWDDEGKRYAWSCYIELPGGVLKGVFNDNELPPDLAAMLARAALEETK